MELPKECGKLTNLKKLILDDSVIKLLPPSTGQLRKLEELKLKCNENLFELPEEIGNLESLKFLRFDDSIIDSFYPTISQKLCLSQGRKRAMSRTGFGSDQPMYPSLWPLLFRVFGLGCRGSIVSRWFGAQSFARPRNLGAGRYPSASVGRSGILPGAPRGPRHQGSAAKDTEERKNKDREIMMGELWFAFELVLLDVFATNQNVSHSVLCIVHLFAAAYKSFFGSSSL